MELRLATPDRPSPPDPGSPRRALWRSRWAAIGAAIAVGLGATGLYSVFATPSVPSSFVPITPCRLFDTRAGVNNVGPRSTPLTAGETYTQQVTGDNGNCTGIPAAATAVALNVTSVGGTATSYLTVYPADVGSRPIVSSLNWVPGAPPNPNKVDVQLSPTGAIKLFNFAGTVNLLADVVGYYLPVGGASGEDARPLRLVGVTSGPVSTPAIDAQPAIALGADRLPIVAYYDQTNGDLRAVQCIGACSGSTSVLVDAGSPPASIVGQVPSIAIGNDGLPVIAHYDSSASDLRVTHCGNTACSASTTVSFVDASVSGFDPAIAIGSDGLPIIAYSHANTDVRVTHCGDVLCTPALAVSTTIVTTGLDVYYVSIAIGTDGFAVIARQSGDGDLRVTHCENLTCSASTTRTADDTASLLGYYTSIAIGVDGFPVIAHQILTDGTLAGADLRVTHCTTVTCSSAVSTTIETTNSVGHYASLVIGPDGRPVIAHRNDSLSRLHVTRCDDVACTTATVFTPPDSVVSGYATAAVIDALGLPVVVHISTSGDVRVTILTPSGWGP